MFQFDFNTQKIVDPEDGAELKTVSSHPHATENVVGVFDHAGKKILSATFRNYSIDVAENKQVIDPPGQRALLKASALDEHGRWQSLTGAHPDLDRLIEYYRISLESKTNVDRFVLLDLRNESAI